MDGAIEKARYERTKLAGLDLIKIKKELDILMTIHDYGTNSYYIWCIHLLLDYRSCPSISSAASLTVLCMNNVGIKLTSENMKFGQSRLSFPP